MSDRIIYSAIFGGRDDLREPTCEIPPGIRLVLFTDDVTLRSKKWEIIHVEASGNPRLQARWFKLLSHVVFPDAKATLWLDALFTLRGLAGVFDQATQFGLHKHPRRDCVYQEIEQVRRNRQDDPEILDRVRARYESELIEPHAGLWMTGVLFRRHTSEVKRFNELWWEELSANSIRDQISFPYVARKAGLEFETVPRGVPSVRWGDHKR